MGWSTCDERAVRFWHAEEILRRDYRALAQQTATVMREVAVTCVELARTYDDHADRAIGERAEYLRARARRLDARATRAIRFAKKREQAANG